MQLNAFSSYVIMSFYLIRWKINVCDKARRNVWFGGDGGFVVNNSTTVGDMTIQVKKDFNTNKLSNGTVQSAVTIVQSDLIV